MFVPTLPEALKGGVPEYAGPCRVSAAIRCIPAFQEQVAEDPWRLLLQARLFAVLSEAQGADRGQAQPLRQPLRQL